MKIGFLSKMFPPTKGGSATYAYEMATALGRRGHDVDVFTQLPRISDQPTDTPRPVSVHSVAKPRRHLVTFETLYYSAKSRLEVDLDAYDVIHGTLMPASTIALSDGLTFKTPIVLTCNSFSLSEVFAHSAVRPADYLLKYAFHPMNVVMDNLAARSADHVIAISTEMAAQLTARYRLPERKVSTVLHGVDTETFHPDGERHPAVSADRFTLLFVGRLVTRKGADLAIEAVQASGHDEIELLIAGEGRLERNLKRLASDRGVADRVRFLGYVPDEDLPSLYSSADVLLFTSNYEGFGLVVLESMASGTPVIAPPVGGVPDVIENGLSGYIVERNASAVADRIDQLVSDRRQLSQMSVAARNAAEERDWSRVAEEVETIYENVLP